MLAVCGPLASAASTRATDVLPEVPAPPMGDAVWIARSMRMNGLPMTLKTLRSRLSVDALFDHYESWAATRASSEVRRSHIGSWQVLAIRAPAFLVTIQVRAISAGSEGTIAVSPLPETARLEMRTDFPLPQSITVANLQQYDDFGVRSEHISAISARSPASEALALSQLLSAADWQITRERTSTHVHRGYVIEAQRGAAHALITLMPDNSANGMTAIVIVWRR
jgi:hypothetical protein